MPSSNGVLISVVDDDESLRESLKGLFKSLGCCVEVFASAESFLSSEALAKTKCLILDVRMPGMSGPDLRQLLGKQGHRIPTIFISAHGETEVISRMIADGGVECLSKPFGEDSLLNAVAKALAA
jgi:FixJ family two-component response regulator